MLMTMQFYINSQQQQFVGETTFTPLEATLYIKLTMDYTITLTDTQVKSLEYITDDPKNWITNAATARAQIATAEIIKKGKTIATMKGEVFSMDGKLAATLIHTAVIMKGE